VSPDIDLDFQPQDRAGVIAYLKRKHGNNFVKNMSTTITLGARAALREVSRVTDNVDEIDSIIKSFPLDQSLTLDIIEESEIYKDNKDNKLFVKLFQVAKKLEGLPKAFGVHAAGIALSYYDMSDFVPFFKCSDREVTQYSQDFLDYLGILKLDILGLNTLQIISKTLDMLEIKNKGEYLDFLDISDQNVYAHIRSGNIAGVFQWDSYNYERVIEGVQPSRFKDLVDLNAVGRSAPQMSGLTERYINRKAGREAIEPLHPRLKGLMLITNELPIYQEQIMLIFTEIAGYTMAEADDVRKAIGKKIVTLMEEQKIKFIAGCDKNNISENEAREIWAIIEQFSKY
jgi:DNA polymerase-3 subunit alpha